LLTHYAAFAKAKELGYGSCKEIITGNNFQVASCGVFILK